jgi:hypothetical protein
MPVLVLLIQEKKHMVSSEMKRRWLITSQNVNTSMRPSHLSLPISEACLEQVRSGTPSGAVSGLFKEMGYRLLETGRRTPESVFIHSPGRSLPIIELRIGNGEWKFGNSRVSIKTPEPLKQRVFLLSNSLAGTFGRNTADITFSDLTLRLDESQNASDHHFGGVVHDVTIWKQATGNTTLPNWIEVHNLNNLKRTHGIVLDVVF